VCSSDLSLFERREGHRFGEALKPLQISMK